MNILEMSKTKNTATVKLTSDDLVKICNAMGEYMSNKDTSPEFKHLYADLMRARDLSQYGHIDDFCLNQILKTRLTGH